MPRYRSDFLNIVTERGFVHQASDEAALDALLADKPPQTCYIGFDCTADSLHVGSLVSIMLLRWWQKTGHRPIVLMGGGTTKVGDPSGKDDSRQLLTPEQIAANMAGIKGVFAKFLKFGEGPTDARMADNATWLDTLQYIPFLRDYGRHFSVNRMLTFDSVKLRLEREQPLTFLEFNYMVLQAYDFLELARRYDCAVQMGGSDQWGNIINGVDLGRRADGRTLFALTTPLLTTAAGEKMGKTARGAVWLNADKLSPYDYYQFWRNTQDADVERFLKLFTELPLPEIAKLAALQGSDINEAKKALAFESTKLAHGEAAAQAAAETARATFEEGAMASGLPTREIAAPRDARIPILTLVREAGLAASNGEVRRLVQQAGVSIDDEVVRDAAGSVDAQPGTIIKVSKGKKQHVLVHVVAEK
jgi:tyrosyl-tRNA synthetase